MKVLFVCSGNICRSAMAEAYFRHRAAAEGLSHLVVASGGTLGIRGATASPEAMTVMAEIGVDLTSHRSRGISGSDIRTSDHVIAMTYDHLDWLAERFPEEYGARRLLRAFEQGAEPRPDAKELPDPIGHPIQFYREQRPLLTGCLDHLLLYLKHAG